MSEDNILKFKLPAKSSQEIDASKQKFNSGFNQQFSILEQLAPEIYGCPEMRDAHMTTRKLYYEALQNAISCLQFCPETEEAQLERERDSIRLVVHMSETLPRKTEQDIGIFYSCLDDIIG